MLDAREAFLERRCGAVDSRSIECELLEVEVRVAQTGQHDSALERQDLCAGAGEAANRVGRPGVNDTSIGNGEGLDRSEGRIQGVNDAVGQDQLDRRGGLHRSLSSSGAGAPEGLHSAWNVQAPSACMLVSA